METITDPVKIKAAAAYNAAADHFDDEALGLWAKYGRRTVERLALQPGANVLDVGCGAGASAIPAAEKVGPNGRVVAVDLADRLLEIARRKVASRKLENIEFRRGDMLASRDGWRETNDGASFCPDPRSGAHPSWRHGARSAAAAAAFDRRTEGGAR